MNSDENNYDESDSDEEIEQSVKGTAGAIVLINIFDPESEKSWKPAHVATCQLVRHYLRTQSTQYLGVSLYGTDDDNPSIFALKSLKDIFPLSSPTLNDYNILEKTDISTVKQSKELVLSEVLGHCSKMFSACKKTLSLRTIIMLTSLDQAPASYDREATLECVEDLVRSGIEIKIVNVAKNDQSIHNFYYDFLFEAYKIDDEKDLTVPKHVWAPEEIKNKMITHCDRQLSIAELPFELGSDVFVGVKIYKLLKSQIAPKTSYIHRETKATIFSKRMIMKQTKKEEDNMDQDDDEEKKRVPVISEEILYGQEYGGKKIEFTHSEYNFIKNPFGSTMMKLLGFKPVSLLRKEKWFIENCYFLFPSEAKIEGSTIAFNALYHACKEMEVAAICMLLTRKNARPKVVALSPSAKPFGINADIGFDIIVLPFVENVRNLPDIEENDAIEIPNERKEEMNAMMNDIINSTKFNYEPEMFENPVLQHKYKMIEAKALEDEEIPETRDTTKPSEDIFKDLNDEEFYKLFGPFGPTATKRTKEFKESNSGPKKAKTNDIDENVLQEDIKNKKVDKYSVEQLKQVLKNLNITGLSKKKKNELVQLVYDHYA